MTQETEQKLADVAPNALEAIAHNLCSLHGFHPGFVVEQERFAKAVITEYLRATPAAPPSPSGWRSMESAPRDGTEVLLFANRFAGEVSGPVDCSAVTTGSYSNGRSDYAGEAWWDVPSSTYAAWCIPTHWMPLPEAPGSAAPSPDTGKMGGIAYSSQAEAIEVAFAVVYPDGFGTCDDVIKYALDQAKANVIAALAAPVSVGDGEAVAWLDGLEKLADAATQGPWFYRDMTPNTYGPAFVDGADVQSLAICGEAVGRSETHGFCLQVDSEVRMSNAAFIAAANPAAVKRLIAMARARPSDPDATERMRAALSRAVVFNAGNIVEPLVLRFEFASEEDRLAAANAIDAALGEA